MMYIRRICLLLGCLPLVTACFHEEEEETINSTTFDLENKCVITDPGVPPLPPGLNNECGIVGSVHFNFKSQPSSSTVPIASLEMDISTSTVPIDEAQQSALRIRVFNSSGAIQSSADFPVQNISGKLVPVEPHVVDNWLDAITTTEGTITAVVNIGGQNPLPGLNTLIADANIGNVTIATAGVIWTEPTGGCNNVFMPQEAACSGGE